MDDTQLATLEEYVNTNVPLGDWIDKPAVPATTVTAENTSGYPMIVEVTASGATITVVKVDGVTIGARTSGGFRVRAGSTIALTYSGGTPTWQWFFEV